MLTRLAFSLSRSEKQQAQCTDVFVIFMRGSHRVRARHILADENARKRRYVNPGRVTSSSKIRCRIAGFCKDKHQQLAVEPRVQEPAQPLFSRWHGERETGFLLFDELTTYLSDL